MFSIGRLRVAPPSPGSVAQLGQDDCLKDVSVCHPSVYRLIEVFKEIEASNECNTAQLQIGTPPKKKKAKL
jgi:hypothetical protein